MTAHMRKTETPTHISLNLVVGLSSPKTMKLRGKINEQPVVVKIDPRATQTFISIEATKKLGVLIMTKKGFVVTLGNGEAVKGTESVMVLSCN